MSEEFYARSILGLIGLVFGMIPLIFGIVRRQIAVGVISAVLCAAVSAAGLPYISVFLAPACCYPVYRLALKKAERDQKAHRDAYRKYQQAKVGHPEQNIGAIENRNVANVAWPPVEQIVDQAAVAEYQRLAESEENDRAKSN